jgi:hypothetical protein
MVVNVDDIVSNEDVIEYVIDNNFGIRSFLSNPYDRILTLNLTGAL